MVHICLLVHGRLPIFVCGEKLSSEQALFCFYSVWIFPWSIWSSCVFWNPALFLFCVISMLVFLSNTQKISIFNLILRLYNILSRATSLGAPLYGGVRTCVEGQRGREVHSHRNLPNPALISPRGPHRRSRQYISVLLRILATHEAKNSKNHLPV